MKKIILTIAFILFLAPTVMAKSVAPEQQSQTVAIKEVKAVLNEYVKYENAQDLDGIKNLHSDDYITIDAMPKKVYLDIINKTWKKYSDVKHQMNIKNVQINGNYAIAEVEEILSGTTTEQIDDKSVTGDLKSVSNVVYYLEHTRGSWKFASDYVVDEQTVLAFEKAKDLDIKFYAPNRILANKDYVVTFNVKGVPRDSFAIIFYRNKFVFWNNINSVNNITNAC